MKNIKLVIVLFSLLTASIAFGFAADNEGMSVRGESIRSSMRPEMRPQMEDDKMDSSMDEEMPSDMEKM